MLPYVGNNDACNAQSLISWSTVQDELYYVLIHGFGSETGSFALQIRNNQASYNGAGYCASAVALQYSETVEVSLQYATAGAGVKRCYDSYSGNELPIGVWYTIVGTGDWVTVSWNGALDTFYSSNVDILNGTSCSGLSCVSADCSGVGSCSWQSTKGETFYVFVYLNGGLNGGFLNLTIS